jgi:hypothetical protein
MKNKRTYYMNQKVTPNKLQSHFNILEIIYFIIIIYTIDQMMNRIHCTLRFLLVITGSLINGAFILFLPIYISSSSFSSFLSSSMN